MKVKIRNPRRARQGGPGVGHASFPDVDGFTTAGWANDGDLVVEFDHDLTPAELATVRERCESLTDSEEQLRADARAWLERTNPTPKQTADQVRLLTRLVLEDYGDGGV